MVLKLQCFNLNYLLVGDVIGCMWDGTLRTRTTSDRVFFFSVNSAGLNARFSRCRGAAEDLPHLPALRRGQKSNGRGVQTRIPLSFVYRVPPSPLHIYVRCGFRQGGPGERPQRPHPKVHTGNAKSGVERKYSTPPEKLERNTIGPTSPISALEKRGLSGYNKATVQSQDCCVEWPRHSS